MSTPLPISVVIPAYQAAADVAAAVASARAQSRPPAEIIVVDDGSTDGTAAAALAAGADRVIRQVNAGAAAARNAGVRAAREPWVAFLDADDRWREHKLAEQWRALALAPHAALVACGFTYERTSDGRVRRNGMLRNRGWRCASPRALAAGVALVEPLAAARSIPVGQYLFPSTIVVRRELALDEHGFAERGVLAAGELAYVSEDAEWLLRVFRHGPAVVVLAPLVRYRVVAGSLSSNAGLMRYGDVVLGELVRARPERYVAGAGAVMARLRASRLREAAVQYVRASSFVAAETIAAQLHGERRTVVSHALRAAIAFAATPHGRRATAVARRVWRRGRAVASLVRP